MTIKFFNSSNYVIIKSPFNSIFSIFFMTILHSQLLHVPQDKQVNNFSLFALISQVSIRLSQPNSKKSLLDEKLSPSYHIYLFLSFAHACFEVSYCDLGVRVGGWVSFWFMIGINKWAF